MSTASYWQPVQQLEQAFGNPWLADNPLGFDAILAADEQADMLAAGELVLDELGLMAQFVPARLGGRLQRLDQLVRMQRAVFRHDPCLGLGYGGSTLIAAVNVWAAGSAQQQQQVAQLLLAGGKLACGYHELAHGNDLARAGCAAEIGEDQITINGGKEVIASIGRAGHVVLYARSADRSGSRSHSLLLLDKAELAGQDWQALPRFETIGMRGIPLGGMRWNQCKISRSSLIGQPGQALETALKSFQVTRATLPGMFLGILDTGLRCALRYAGQRHLYGKTVLDLPHSQTVLADAFADLLLADCISTVVTRALHVQPATGSVYAAACKFLLPKLMQDAMGSLSALLGAQFYIRDGEHSMFQKLLRDLKPASFGHAARVTCQMTILPQLPGLAKRAWGKPVQLPPAWFLLDAALPDFDFAALTLSNGNADPLMASLPDRLAQVQDEPALAQLAAWLGKQLERVQAACAALPPNELAADASADSYTLCQHAILLQAISACLNLWWYNRAYFAAHDPFLASPDTLAILLQRLASQFGQGMWPTTATQSQHLFGALAQRYAEGVSFDLDRGPLPGWQAAASVAAVSDFNQNQ